MDLRSDSGPTREANRTELWHKGFGGEGHEDIDPYCQSKR